MLDSYVSGVENAPPPSWIPVENSPPPSCIPVKNAPPPSCIPEENAHRHRVYVPSAGAGGCAIRSLVGTTAAWEEQVEKDNVKCWNELKIECETH